MNDAWHVSPNADGKLPTFLAHSTLDAPTAAAIASGLKPFPPYHEIPLTPQRRLLHEVIVQAVTERKLLSDVGQSYEHALATAVAKAVHSSPFEYMQEHGEVDARKVSALLDSIGLARLPTHPNAERATAMVAIGGPAIGKKDLVAGLALQEPEIYLNAAIVNSDDYKLLLADKAEYGNGYANAAHAESSYLSDEIMNRLSQKIDSGRAPHVVLDVVTLSPQRMAFAAKSGTLIVAAGTAPPEVALERSRQRGLETDRVVPSAAVLAGAGSAAATTPRVFEHANLKMELFDTNVPYGGAHTLVAEWVPATKTLAVHKPDTFVDFVERQKLNPTAKNPGQLLPPEMRTPQIIAHELAAYTDRGVTLAFLNERGELAVSIGPHGVDEVRPLESHRGRAFFPALAGASNLLLEGAARSAGHSTVHEEANPHGEPHGGRGAVVGAGVGAALGAKGLYNDLAQPESRLHRDMQAGGVQQAAGTGRFATQAADATISGAAAVEGAYRFVARSSQTAAGMASELSELGPMTRLAGRVAIPLALTAGALEAGAGIAEHNPRRVAGAVGSTGGGIIGGIVFGAAAGAAWGAAGGSETGPGALVTAGVGALAGAVWGGTVGEDKAKEHLTETVDKAMHLFDATPAPAPAAAQPAMSPDMMRALGMAKSAGISRSLECDARYVTDLGALAVSLGASAPSSKAAPGR